MDIEDTTLGALLLRAFQISRKIELWLPVRLSDLWRRRLDPSHSKIVVRRQLTDVLGPWVIPKEERQESCCKSLQLVAKCIN